MQITGTLSGGLVVEDITDSSDRDADDYDATAQKLLDALRAYQRGQVKAAAAYAVDAINSIARDHSINCGASL